MDLSTTYLELALKNPLVASASPLTRSLDSARRLEDAGIAAVVMYSLFEEELLNEQEALDHFMHGRETGNPEATLPLPVPGGYHTGLDDYLEQLHRLKQALDVPVIASLNGVSTGGWVETGRQLQEAGADALELNTYFVAADAGRSGAEVEASYVELLTELRKAVTIPIAMKLSPQFSSLAAFAQRLAQAGADGLVLFNRFYQPDIDLETLEVVPSLQLSTPDELRLRMRWLALLHGRLDLSLAATGGVHGYEEVLKVMLAGADVAQMCSALLVHGPARVAETLDGLGRWLEEREYASLRQLVGSVSQRKSPDPAAFERANYMRVLDSYTPPPGVWS
ncbi:MAG: dihydroorotate dehydrogenase-like protein [Gammaproteobacteria bacterium]|nr:dihydroorotate dehydrogenase-like protein [Gammaproteobacteria bacterium]